LIHPLPKLLDTSPKLLTLLRAFGMEELLPVFFAAEIKRDSDFNLFYDLDEDGRQSVFEPIVKNFKLKPFQMMMLGVVARGVGVDC
jgi:hypothetical protein